MTQANALLLQPSNARFHLLAAALLALASLAGCADQDEKDDDSQYARVWSFADIREAAHDGELVANVAATKLIDFRGQPIAQRSPPFAVDTVTQDPDVDGAPVFAAFAEGKPAAYMATDFWYDRSPLWVQPVYQPVTAWDASNPAAAALPGSSLVFSVGQESSFYSPYWEVEFVEVPTATRPEDVRSVKQLLDLGGKVHSGVSVAIYSLVPSDAAPSAPAGGASVRPLNGDPVMDVEVGQGWLDGASVSYFDYGPDAFTYSATGVIDEVPLFDFVAGLPDGGVLSLGLPRVGGVGPPYSGKKADAPGGVPYFGGLWRVYQVALPTTAAVLVPPALTQLKAQLSATGLFQVPDLGDDVAAFPKLGDYALRVATDGSCFGGDAGFPDSCTWLDSQAAIEAAFPPGSMVATKVTVTCPFLEYLGQPVPNP